MIYITISKDREGDIVKIHWLAARLRTIWAKPKFCIVMPEVKILFRSEAPFRSIDCNPRLSFELFLLLVDLQQASQVSGISNILDL